jgi:AAA domain
VRLPGLADKGDVSDWLDADRRNASKLEGICFDAPLWQPDIEKQPRPKANGTAKTSLQIVRADTVAQKPVEWLWQNRIARGKLTLSAGDPGMGKSQVAADIVARITTGSAWPDGDTAPLGSCLILSAEDAANDTICPRLELAGANLQKVHIIQAAIENGQQRGFNLQRDLEALAATVKEIVDASFLCIDPITAYLGEKVDSHRTTDVRAVLNRLERFADEQSMAIWAITHPPKAAQGKAINNFTGSLAFVASARLAFMSIEEAETDRTLLLTVKNNLGPKAEGIGYRLVQGFTSKDVLTSHVAWDTAPVVMTANEALAAAADEVKKGRHRREAEEFLQGYLGARPMPAEAVIEAAAANDISKRTLDRAKKDLGIVVRKDDFDRGWTWQLP